MHGYAVSLHVCVWGRVSAQKHKKKVMKTLSPWDNRGIAAVYPRTVPSSLVPIHRVPSVVKVNASRENPDLAAVKPAIVSPSLNCVHRVPSASIMATTRCMIGMSKWNLNVSSKYNILLLVLVLSIQSVVCTHTINPNTALPLFVSRCIYIYRERGVKYDYCSKKDDCVSGECVKSTNIIKYKGNSCKWVTKGYKQRKEDDE